MATSYKALYQEEKKKAEALEAKIERLQQQHRRELEKIHAFLQANRSKLGETRAIVDLAGVARHMRVARYTPQQWQQRDLLPPVDFPEIREPLWYASTIIDGFAKPTGRVWYDTAEDTDDGGDALSPAA